MQKNRRAQVSEVMTWMVATVIILLILLIFVYASSILAQKTKLIKTKDLKIDIGKKVSLIEAKNLIAYSSASVAERNIMERWEKEK